MTAAGFDPFTALAMLSALVMAGLVGLQMMPGQRHPGRLSLALAAVYLVGGVAIFAVAWLR